MMPLRTRPSTLEGNDDHPELTAQAHAFTSSHKTQNPPTRTQLHALAYACDPAKTCLLPLQTHKTHTNTRTPRSLLATATKSKSIHVTDPRAGCSVARTPVDAFSRSQRVEYCCDFGAADVLLTVGTASKGHGRRMALWCVQ